MGELIFENHPGGADIEVGLGAQRAVSTHSIHAREFASSRMPSHSLSPDETKVPALLGLSG